MSSHFQSAHVLSASTCFASPSSSDEADQIHFQSFAMHDKEYTLLSHETSYSDMNTHIDYDKSNSGYGTPTTSSSDGEYPGKPVATASPAVALNGGTNGNDDEAGGTPTPSMQNGLKRKASQAFFPTDILEVDAAPFESEPSTSVKPAQDEFDTLNATIERVALREGVLARRRKEEEEAAFATTTTTTEQKQQLQQVEQPSPEAKRPRLMYSHSDHYGIGTPQHDEPQPSTSSAYAPVEPIDTTVSMVSTPMGTPGASGILESPDKKRKCEKKKKEKMASVSCRHVDDVKKTNCKQRAILGFEYCIRHILSDDSAPYKRCDYVKRPKNKPDASGVPCTNAIARDAIDIYCTTHLIMMGLREPKKKKPKVGDDAVSTTQSVDGNDSILTTTSSQVIDESSMAPLENDDRGINGGSRPPTAATTINGFEQPSRTSSAAPWDHSESQGYAGFGTQVAMDGFDPMQPGPSTAFYASDGQSQQQPPVVYHPPPPVGAVPHELDQYDGPTMQMMPPPTAITFSLIQNANGDQVLVDENGVEQPAGSYTITQTPDGSLQASFHNLDHRQGEMTPDSGFPSATPPESTLPMFADDQRRHLYHSQSVDGNKTYDPRSFPPSQAPSIAPTPQPQSAPVLFNDVSRQHPQLSARLLQPLTNQSQSSFPPPVSTEPFIISNPQPGPMIIEQPVQQFQQGFNNRAATVDNVMYYDPVNGTVMPPPPLPPPSRTQSRSSSTRTMATPQPAQYCTMVTFANGEMHMMPIGTKVLENVDGSRVLITPPGALLPPASLGPPIFVQQAQVTAIAPMPAPQPEMIVEQIVEVEQQPAPPPPQLPPPAPPPPPPPVNIDPMDMFIGTRAPNPFLSFERPPKYATVTIEANSEDEEKRMVRDYAVQEKDTMRKDKMITLRQKRQRMRIGGSFRKIPIIDDMSRALEDHDFDGTDLFPLGLEPSDDDEESEDEGRTFAPTILPPGATHKRNTAIELYLLKKNLRLEKARLRKNALITGPLMAAGRMFPNSAGAALRTRDHYRKGLTLPETKPFRERRCYHMQSFANGTGKEHRSVRCPKPCLPRANHCADHIQHNIDQFLYEDCKVHDCERPMLPSEALLTDGYCRHHYDQEIAKKEAAEAEAATRNQQIGRDGKIEYLAMRTGSRDVDSIDLDDLQPGSSYVLPHGYQRHLGRDIGDSMGHDEQESSMEMDEDQLMEYEADADALGTDSSGMGSSGLAYPSALGHEFDETNPAYYSDQTYDSNTDGLSLNLSDADISLASVVKDLGINSDALNEVLAQAEALNCGSDVLDEFPLGRNPGHATHLNMDNSWEDIHSFLLSEGHPCSRARKKKRQNTDNAVAVGAARVDRDVNGIVKNGEPVPPPSTTSTNGINGVAVTRSTNKNSRAKRGNVTSNRIVTNHVS